MTDGTAAGTALVADINPGSGSSTRASSRRWATEGAVFADDGRMAASCG